MGDFLPWTPMNRRAKFDALSTAEKNKQNKETNNKRTNEQTNKQKTHKQTVTDIYALLLSATMDILSDR